MSDVQADTPKVIQLSSGIWVRQEIDNIAWINLGSFAVVIDALEHVEKADEVFAAIERDLGQTPIKYLINTHTHYDHVALNDAFVDRYGCEIINAETTNIPAKGKWLEDGEIVNTETTKIGPEGKWLEDGERRVLIQPAPGCHTDQDVIIWCEPERVLFVGDIFGWGLIPLIAQLRPANTQHLVETYQRLIHFDAKVVVPGHGPMATTADLARWLEYFDWLVAKIAMAVAAGADDTQIIAEIPPPADMLNWWRFVARKHADCIVRIAKSIRRGWLNAK